MCVCAKSLSFSLSLSLSIYIYTYIWLLRGPVYSIRTRLDLTTHLSVACLVRATYHTDTHTYTPTQHTYTHTPTHLHTHLHTCTPTHFYTHTHNTRLAGCIIAYVIKQLKTQCAHPSHSFMANERVAGIPEQRRMSALATINRPMLYCIGLCYII